MFYIEVICLSWFFCTTPPPAYSRFYETPEQCDQALIELVKAWKPVIGSYRFNCRKLSGASGSA